MIGLRSCPGMFGVTSLSLAGIPKHLVCLYRICGYNYWIKHALLVLATVCDRFVTMQSQLANFDQHVW